MARMFSAKIYKLGINPCVDVPKSVSDIFGRRGYVPVEGTLNGQASKPDAVDTVKAPLYQFKLPTENLNAPPDIHKPLKGK